MGLIKLPGEELMGSMFLKTRIIFGEAAGTLGKLGLTGRGLLCSRRHLNLNLENLDLDRLPVEPEPTVDDVRRYWSEIRDGRYDYVLAIGGGSVIDTAKVLGALMTNDVDPAEFVGEERVVNESRRIIAVPTTHGSGSEVTKYAVLKMRDAKRSIVSERICPETAVLDVALTMGLPRHLTLFTSIDAFCHSIEAYLTRFSDPVVDVICQAGVRKFFEGIDGAMADERGGRERMVLCSVLGGMAINAAQAYLVHALSHVIGAMLDIPHGMANALFLPGFLRFHENHGKMRALNEAVGFSVAERMEEVYERYRVKRLSEFVSQKEAEEIAERAHENRRLMSAGEREITLDDLRKIVSLCL
jgi:alcohol dehydrogenase class IV